VTLLVVRWISINSLHTPPLLAAVDVVQFHDGVYLVLLMGLLEGYFVPLHHFHLTPTTNDQKVDLSLQLNFYVSMSY